MNSLAGFPRWRTLVVGGTAVGVGMLALGWMWRRMSTSAKQTFEVDVYRSLLGPVALGQRVDYRDKVDSTMTVAKEKLRECGPEAHGYAVLAEEQTCGVGRRDRSWRSAPAGNIYVSYVWAPKRDTTPREVFDNMMKMNFAICVAVVTAVKRLTGIEGHVKWPNDVWIGKRKLCGCLIDCDGKFGGVAGIGINVHERMMETKQLEAVSLADVAAGKVPSRETLLANVFQEIERLMKLSWPQVLHEYRQFDMLEGQLVRVHHKARETDSPDDYNAKVLGFEDNGNLRVARQDNGKTVALSAEEVSLRPAR